MQDHGGHAEVKSAVGEGTEFEIFFPATRGAVAVRGADAVDEPFLGNGETVLVVDGVSEQREIARLILERLGYSVTAVSSGEQAWSTSGRACGPRGARSSSPASPRAGGRDRGQKARCTPITPRILEDPR